MVAAGHPETVQAAVDVLDAGGNAYDATVAAGFAGAAAEPGLTSLGGGGFLLARTAEGEETLFDFFVDTPGRGLARDDLQPHFTPVTVRFKGADQVFHAGYGSVAVPGCLPGYLHVHRRLGRLELARVVAPAVRLASEGVVLNEQQAEIFDLLEGIFLLSAQGRAVFCRGEELLRRGDLVRNPDLASFLEEIGRGRSRGFPDPEIASSLARAMAEGDGLVTEADLAAYRVMEREPLVFGYRGARIATNPPPSFGGELVAHALERLGPQPPHPFGSTSEALRLARVLQAMSDDRAGDGRPRARQGTTHVSVADAEGNVAAMTTSNGSCSGVFVPGTGVQLNNIMGEEDLHPEGFHSAPPGERVGSMMAPTIIEHAGRVMALGSGGSERIRSALLQVLVQLIDHDRSLQRAVSAPRMHWDGSRLQIEPGFAREVVRALAGTLPVNEWSVPNLYFGGAHAVSTRGEVAGDPRRGGSCAVLVEPVDP